MKTSESVQHLLFNVFVCCLILIVNTKYTRLQVKMRLQKNAIDSLAFAKKNPPDKHAGAAVVQMLFWTYVIMFDIEWGFVNPGTNNLYFLVENWDSSSNDLN